MIYSHNWITRIEWDKQLFSNINPCFFFWFIPSNFIITSQSILWYFKYLWIFSSVWWFYIVEFTFRNKINYEILSNYSQDQWKVASKIKNSIKTYISASSEESQKVPNTLSKCYLHILFTYLLIFSKIWTRRTKLIT